MQLVAGVAMACAQRARLVTTLAMLAAALALAYTAANVRFSTDRDALLSPELDFKRVHAAFQADFPMLRDDLVVVLDATTPEAARSAAMALCERLEQSGLFQSVRAPRAEAYLERHALLFMDTPELAQLVQRLAEAQPFLGRLAREPSLVNLLETLALACGERERAGELGPLLAELAAAGRATLAGRTHATSWLELLQGSAADPDRRRQVVLAAVQRDFGALFPGQEAIAAARAALRELARERPDVSARMTGELLLADEELRTVQRGAARIATLVFACVVVLVYLGLRSWRMVLATLFCLLVGLVFTAAFATAAVGHLNLISIVFAALYLGLAGDYAIHLCLRLGDFMAAGEPLLVALRGAVSSVGRPLVLCCMTTASGFFAFVPTAYRGVSELGLIAGCGMFISLGVTFLLLPAALALLGVPRLPRHRPPPAALHALQALPFRRRTAVRLVSAALILSALLVVPRVRFDENPLNLRDPRSESVATFRALLASPATRPWSSHALASDRASASRLAARLDELGGRVLWLGSFVPTDQDAKLELLADAELLLGGTLEPAPDSLARDDAERRAALDALRSALPLAGAAHDMGGLGATLDELARRAPSEPALLLRLEQSLLGELETTFVLLREGLAAEAVGWEDLPRGLVARWVAADGRHRVEVFPANDLDAAGAMQAFVADVTAAARDERATSAVTGPPLMIVLSARAIVTAFRQALAYAFGAVALMLLLLLRRPRDIVVALATLGACALLTGASTVLLGLDFDFANVIALPLLLGIGVDTALLMLDRAHEGRELGEDPQGLLGTSTARGVVLCAATTYASFAGLATSAHPGTAGMGLLLCLGYTWTLLVGLLALPACLPSARGSAPLS
jgi:hypothetical protein